MQLKVLDEFRTRMQEHKKLVAEASKSDKKHRQALEGLQSIVDSTLTVYEHLQADLRKSESNVLNLTKQLDNANAAQRVATEALEDLEVAKKGRNEAEAEVAQLVGKKKEMEAKLENVEVDFVANFHNTEAYTNFSEYFARVGHQKVLTVLRTDHPSFDLGPLEARFPPPDVESEEDS
ncbi:hypothetical protein Adt_39781 [Abeliophyllum distichum]|uniref:Uncharacterized protein n=1 Tax=Abeliophyllum distichum TaxID=126358 RepID=A0ABD1Q627_9LAMI